MFDPRAGADEEYERARRQIETSPEGDGEWVRPEGLSAEKRRNAMFPRIAKLFEPATDKELAKKLRQEADVEFQNAISLEGSERAVTFRAAARLYKKAGKSWKGSYLEQDALFMEGRSYFFAEDYTKAEDAFTRLVKEYPRTKYLDAVQKHRFEIAQYWVDFHQVESRPFYVLNLTDNRLPWNDVGGHGTRVFERMRMDDPTGPLADDVTMALANSQFRKGDFETAADTYEDLRLTYPDSRHQFEAHFLELKCCLEYYQGPQYSSEPLDRAEKLVKQMRRQFPQQAQEQTEYLSRSYAEVRYYQGERLWFQAEYRRNRGENRASRYYLDQIVQDFDDTPFAAQAKETLAQLEGLPDDPKQYLVWLTKMFPENDPVKPLLRDSGDSTIMR